MYADRYAPSRPKPFSLGAAVAINGGILAALILAPPEVLPPIFSPPIETTNIPIEPEPQPDPPKPRDKLVERTDPEPYVPPRTVDTGVDEGPVVGTSVEPDPGPPTGTGTGVAVDPPAPPPPLFVDASIEGRHQRDFQPPYPSQEIRAGREGSVAVRVLIGTDGRVKAVEKVRATSDAFFEATRRQALARWRFRAATRGGVPEESWKVMTVRFVLES